MGTVIHTFTRDKDYIDLDPDDDITVSCVFPDGAGDFFECDPSNHQDTVDSLSPRPRDQNFLFEITVV